MYETDEDHSFRQRNSDEMVKHQGGHAEPAKAAASPRHDAARRAQGPVADISHGPDRAGDEPGTVDRCPGRGHGNILTVEAFPPVPRAPARSGAQNTGEDLLQV